MKHLPSAELALVDEKKLTAYLLSSSHPAGRSKAAFFHHFGFHGSTWWILRDALLNHARTGEVVTIDKTEFGTKYTVFGPLASPVDRMPYIRTVWFVATGDLVPRLVTAYPAQGAEE